MPRCRPVLSFVTPWLPAGLVLLAASAAQAGTLANGAWQPSACGARPTAPALNLKNPDAYNRSADGVNAYLPVLKAYVDCVTLEANADIQAVSRSANAEQQAAREVREKIQADVKAANDKFK